MVKSNVAIVGPRVRFPADAYFFLRTFFAFCSKVFFWFFLEFEKRMTKKKTTHDNQLREKKITV